MNQASQKIAQQYIDGGVVPAELVGQDGATKSYVDNQLAQRDKNITAVAGAAGAAQSSINNHKADSTVHVTSSEKATYNTHISDGNIHVTAAKKDEWDSKAPGSTQTDLSTHTSNATIHVTPADHIKLDGIQVGAEVNQYAFSKVNGLNATSKTDALKLVGDVGIEITENPLDKSIRFTATGDAAPGPHGPTHDIGGSDPIPGLKQAILDADEAKKTAGNALTTAQAAKETANAAETPVGAQLKVNALAGEGNTKTLKQVDDSVTTHMMDDVRHITAAERAQWSAGSAQKPKVKVGSFTRDLSLASGNQAVTGIGFIPRKIIFFASANGGMGASWGFDTQNTSSSIYDGYAVTPGILINDNRSSINIIRSSSDNYSGKVNTFDNDGFTIKWTKVGSTTGTATIFYMAEE